MGVSPHFVGNAIWEIVALAPGPGSRERKLEHGYNQYRAYCKTNGIKVHCTTWTPEKLNKKAATTYPFMKSKANECKKMVAFVTRLCIANNTGSDHDKWRASAAWALSGYYSMLGDNGRYLSDASLRQLQHYVHVFLTCYYALAAEAQGLGAHAWHVVPKFHMFEHIADTVAPQVNPKHATCYGDEDVVGHVAKTGRKCHRSAVCHNLLQRWRLVCAWRWGDDWD